MPNFNLIAIATLVACSTERPILIAPQTNFEVLRSARPNDPTFPDKSQWLIRSCCPKQSNAIALPETPAACRELERMIEDAPRRELFDDWGPNCYQAISTESLKRALPKDPFDVSRMLVRRDGTAPTITLLFEELIQEEPPQHGAPLRGPSEFLVDALALVGDDELLVLAAELSSNDSRRMHWAVYVLGVAAAVPLAPSTAHAALDHIAEIFNDLLGTRAREAITTWDTSSRAEIDERALRLLEHPREDAIQLLARRRSFCSSVAGWALLASFAHDPDPTIAHLARRAIADRRQRCADR